MRLATLFILSKLSTLPQLEPRPPCSSWQEKLKLWELRWWWLEKAPMRFSEGTYTSTRPPMRKSSTRNASESYRIFTSTTYWERISPQQDGEWKLEFLSLIEISSSTAWASILKLKWWIRSTETSRSGFLELPLRIRRILGCLKIFCGDRRSNFLMGLATTGLMVLR